MTSPRDATTKVTAPTGAEFVPLGRTGQSDSAAITLSQALEGPVIYVAANDSTADAKKYAGTTYTCDGTADEVQVQAAHDALDTNGGTIVLAEGTYNFAAALSITNKVALVGAGPSTIIVPGMGTSVNCINGGAAGSDLYGVQLRNFQIKGGANSCLNGISLTRCHMGKIKDVTVVCGTAAAGFGLLLTGCILNDIDINIAYSPTAGSYTRPANGIKLAVNAAPVFQCNANKIRMWLSSLSGDGFVLTDASNTQNANEISGSIESITGAPLSITRAWLLEVRNLYIDGTNGNSDFTSVNYACIRNSKLVGTDLDLTACTNLRIEDSWIELLNPDADCRRIYVDNVRYEAYPTGTTGTIINKGQSWWRATYPIGQVESDRKNLFYNSNFERWQAAQPDGWSRFGSHTWTKCGTGLADTTTHFTDFCGLWTTVGGAAASNFTLPNMAIVLEQLKGKYFTFSAYLRSPTSGANTPYIYIDGGSTQIAVSDQNVIAANDTWYYVSASGYFPTTSTDVRMRLYTSAAGAVYIAEPCLTIGPMGQQAWNQEANEHNEFIAVAGNKMAWAAAAPVAGYWLQGDVVWNTGAAAGGSPGWVCTTSGTPGTWRTMANVA